MTHAGALEGIPPGLWDEVARAPHRLLMLDYDGTLAPFHADRERARPLPEAIPLLERIAASSRTSVAIVSGRPLDEVERLVGPLRAVFVGEHGWDLRALDGRVIRHALEPRVEAALAEAVAKARTMGWDAFLERKRSSLVLHTRGMAPESARDLEERAATQWEEPARTGLVVQRIDGGLELRAQGRDKGTIVLQLLEASPPGTLGVFVGDDRTDEDAFAAILGRGFGVRVEGHRRPSAATATLPSCGAVPSFLEEWLRVT